MSRLFAWCFDHLCFSGRCRETTEYDGYNRESLSDSGGVNATQDANNQTGSVRRPTVVQPRISVDRCSTSTIPGKTDTLPKAGTSETKIQGRDNGVGERLNDIGDNLDDLFPTIPHNIPKINHGRSGIDTIQSNRNNFRTPYKDIKPATPQVTHTASGINNNTRLNDYDNQFPTILHNIPKINHGRSRIDTIQSNRNNFRTPYKDIKPATPQVTHTASGTNNNTRLNDYDNQFPTILHNIPKINHGRSGIDTIQSNRNNFRTPYKDIKPATPQVTHTASGTNNNTRLNDYDNQFPTILHNIPKINHGRSGIDTIQSNRNNFRTPYKDIKPATPQVTHTASGINNNTRLKDYDNQFPTILHNIPKINHGRSGIDTIQSNRNNFRTPYKDIKPATPQVTHTASGINNNSRLKDYDQFPTILHNIPKINHGTTVNRSFRSKHDTISGLSNGIKPVNTKVSPTLSGINNDTIFTAYGNQFPTVLHNRSEINYGRTEIHSLRSNRCNERPKISDGRRETKTLRPDRDEAEVIPALSGINKFSPTTKQSARSNTLNVSYRSRRRKKRRRQAPSTTPRKINNAELTKKTRDRLISAASELQHQPNEITFLIVEIKKVINPFLYAHYRLKVEQAGEDAEEMFLYHGTSRANLDRIIDDNFDWRCTNRGKYGRGVYFANNPWFASHYSEEDDEGTMVMIAARVIIGRYHLGMVSTEIPLEGYDTTVSPDNQVYAKYDDNTFYPELIFYYKKIDNNNDNN